MTARDYPIERVERYIAALNEADVYAQLERRDDRMRFALAVMAVADAETDPVYKSGYDTGRMHAGAERARVLREAADEIERQQSIKEAQEQERFGFLDHETEICGGAVRDKAAWLRRLADGEKSSREADATPTKLTAREDRLAQLLDTIRTHGGKWSTSSVQQIRRATGGPVQRGTARRDLTELARRGHLVQHGAGDGRYYTLRRKDGRS